MKRSTAVSHWLFVIAVAALAAPTAFSETISGAPCTTGSFLVYKNLDGGCNVGNLLQLLNFRLFSIDPVNGQSTPESDAFLATITVSPAFTGGVLGLGFSGFPPVTADQTAKYELDYTIDPPPVIADMSAILDPPFGNIVGTVVYCGDPNFVTGGCAQSGSYGFGVLSGDPFPGSVHFDNPVSTLITQTFFQLNPGKDTASGFDSLNFTVTTTPEPGAWLLAIGGLGFVAFRRRSRWG
jgi:MYXO-CTERM domain-containing protein